MKSKFENFAILKTVYSSHNILTKRISRETIIYTYTLCKRNKRHVVMPQVAR